MSGQAQYTDDVPLASNALHAAFVTSTRPHARLVRVDPSAATALPGVAGYFGADDVPGDNWIGPVKHDEEVFATKEVTCVGQVTGTISAVLLSVQFCLVCGTAHNDICLPQTLKVCKALYLICNSLRHPACKSVCGAIAGVYRLFMLRWEIPHEVCSIR